ncbi:MAG TPA: polyphosphate polymerase domain-containing protein [Kofleriaceae bacterium]|nr:polyphosphate polymerase domain-containing protein [Kofleriaceae bacterium]
MAGAPPATIRSFNRYELKYIIHASEIPRIVADVCHQMSPDNHGDESGSYVISNLYYDSPGLHMLRSKIVGNNYRRKLRVRTYGNSDLSPPTMAMAEIKQRLGRTTQKRRVMVPLDEALRICDGQSSRTWDDATDRAIVEEIHGLVLALALRPACTISYRRRAFVGSRFEPGLRVTIDTDLWGAPPRLDFYAQRPSAFLIPRDWSILEIKVDNRVPNWINELVTRHNCQLRRVSKYCLGMAKLHDIQLPMAAWPSSGDLEATRQEGPAAIHPTPIPQPIAHNPDSDVHDQQLSAATRIP